MFLNSFFRSSYIHTTLFFYTGVCITSALIIFVVTATTTSISTFAGAK
ncbi:hypothetical protein KBB05_00320 [Patescibacteria group bacterium]|nr:hypothetical protein [Patescibacteria group bacterium]